MAPGVKSSVGSGHCFITGNRTLVLKFAILPQGNKVPSLHNYSPWTHECLWIYLSCKGYRQMEPSPMCNMNTPIRNREDLRLVF